MSHRVSADINNMRYQGIPAGGSISLSLSLSLSNHPVRELRNNFQITAPIAMPIVKSMGYDPIWFGVIFVMNMQVAYISPPFGYNLFYLKSIAPPGIEIKDIYLAIIPFVVIQIIALVIVSIFPQIALWIPRMLLGG
ncbi:MAG: TRAP transporter large permease subunit [Desulfobacterales bacterium]